MKGSRIIYIILFYFFIITQLNASDSFILQQIILKDKQQNIIKDDNINKILSKYIKKEITLETLEKLPKELEKYYSSKGYNYTKVLIPPQTIRKGVLYLIIYKPIIGKIKIEGNKYYSSKFILERFKAKENSYLKYNQMIESLLMINEYSDLNAKIFLKSNKETNKTDITLKITDKRPFHLSIQLDNLGSKNTSKNRINLNASYGNILRDGDNLQFYTTNSLKYDKHNNLYMFNYNIPINNSNTKLEMGILHSNYLVNGEFEILDIKGDTKNYDIGIIQPIFKTFKKSLQFSAKYTKKYVTNYILSLTSSREEINTYDFNIKYNQNSLFSINNLNIGAVFGNIEDNALKTRTNECDKFIKYYLKFVRNQALNQTNNLIFNINGQYSNKYRLPTSELYSIGGESVKGFDNSAGTGDSGYSASIEYSNNILTIKQFNLKAGLFINYGRIFTNSPENGEFKNGSLLGYGINTNLSINNKYSLNISVGYPIDSDSIEYKREAHIYATFNMVLW